MQHRDSKELRDHGLVGAHAPDHGSLQVGAMRMLRISLTGAASCDRGTLPCSRDEAAWGATTAVCLSSAVA